MSSSDDLSEECRRRLWRNCERENNRDFAMSTRSAVDARGYDVTRNVNRSLASRAPRRAVTSTTYSPVARLASGRSIA